MPLLNQAKPDHNKNKQRENNDNNRTIKYTKKRQWQNKAKPDHNWIA